MNALLATSWLGKLIEFDKWLFVQVNGKLANPFFDAVMPFMRTASNWAPLYLFLIAFMLLNFRVRGAWWLLFFVCTVALTDTGGTYLFKHTVGRDRPCADPAFFDQVRLLVGCVGHGNSFLSNHAANHFGMAMFFFMTCRSWLGRWSAVGFIWAGLVALAQVYVGIHFPLDVTAGGLFGCLLGYLTGSLFNKRFQFAIFEHQSTA